MTFVVDGTNGLTFNDATTQSSTATNASNISSGTLGKARLPTGSVLQVVQSVYSTAFSTLSTSYVSIGATASITPTSATSKILAQASVAAGNGSNQWQYFTLYRGATNIAVGSGNPGGYLTQNSIDYLTTINFQILDSPATTSSTTYTLYTKSTGGGSIRAQVDGMPTYITLMEIAA